MSAMPGLIERICKLVAAARISLHDEKAAQRELAALLDAARIEHKREFRLDAHNVVDFLIPEGDEHLALEMKMYHARRADIRRQLERYAGFERISALLLVTNRAIALPPALRGKPCCVASLGAAWL